MSCGNTEKHKTFSAPTEKEITKVDKDCNETIISHNKIY